MIFQPLCTAAGEPGTPYAFYVILAGVVCTGLGWWLRGWYGRQKQSEARTGPAPEPSREGEEALREERGRLAAQLAAAESALVGAESARKDALSELEALRPKAASHDEAVERAHRVEGEHRTALEKLMEAEERAVKESVGIDPAQLPKLQEELAQSKLLEAAAGSEAAALRARLAEVEGQAAGAKDEMLAAAREAAAKALEENQAAVELNTRLHRELEEARAAVGEARAAVASEQSRAEQLVRDLDEARGRIASIESAPSVPQIVESAPGSLEADPAEAAVRDDSLEKALEENKKAGELNASLLRELDQVRTVAQEASAAAAAEQTRAAQLASDLDEARSLISSLETPAAPRQEDSSPGDISQEQLDQARRDAESARGELLAAHEEIRKLKAELSAPKARPILTSPRPEGGAPARQP